MSLTNCREQVVVHALDSPEGEQSTELIHAKYVLGTDGM